MLASLLVAYVGYLAFTLPPSAAPQMAKLPDLPPITLDRLPEMPAPAPNARISRIANLDTIVPTRSRVDIEPYTVEFGDSIFAIAAEFNIAPETLLWANEDLLNDNPDFLEPGMVLNVPPIDGVYYQWQAGDSIESVARTFSADPQDVIDWVGNHLDLLTPVVDPGSWVMIPGGEREFRAWILPTIARGAAGVSKSVYGPGACEGSYEGLYGSGAFIWPSPIHEVVGNDYWSGHLGIDIASDSGTAVYASDAGVVVFSGWSTGGYGYMIMIDHGNGYQTLYAHLSQVNTFCGQSVPQGQTIGYGGTSGNSTGPHLHFEVRLGGGFVNPWFVLPAP